MQTNCEKLSVSCIICFHSEGVLAHTTLHSVERARKFAEQRGVLVQLVMTLDNHDAMTERAVVGHPVIRADDIIDIVKYGDAGASRNHGIRRSSGEYIIIIDGDDYCSDNFIFEFVTQAAADINSVIFPEYLFVFPGQGYYVKMGGPADAQENLYALFSENFYSSRLAAHRDVFTRIPFAECSQGFGYEDWHWACEAVAAGLHFVSAAGVVLFYRNRSGSRVEKHMQAKVIIPPSKFFDRLPPPAEPLPGTPSAMPAPALSRKALARELLIACLQFLPKSFAERIYVRLKGAVAKARHMEYPPAIQRALLEAAAVDGALHPRVLPHAKQVIPHYDTLPGKVYAAIWHALQGRTFDVVYLVPHVGVGGADLMTINYMTAVRRAGKRVLCLLTHDSQRSLRAMPEGVTVVRFARLARCLSPEQNARVLIRLLVQLRPSILHVICDDAMLGLLGTYGKALQQVSRLYATIFADAQDALDNYWGAGTQYLRGLIGNCAGVITDNRATAQEWHTRLGVPLELFHAVYGIARVAQTAQDGGSRGTRILWAGRLDREKRLDILLAIAQALPQVFFDVHGQAVLDEDGAVDALAHLPNVTLCGGYRDFYALPLHQYAALVYTAQYDGLPNVLLEAAACGLPLIAPDRGGISDFVSEATGWLIASHTDVAAYVRTIQTVLEQPEEAMKRARQAQDLLRQRHTPEAFAASLLEAYGLSACTQP